MASGGKDSLSVAWALHELGKSVTLIHCSDRGREDESSEVFEVAERFGQELIVVNDDISVVDAYLRKNAARQSLPNADVAFFAYVRAMAEISKELEELETERQVIILDGMGNDAYMGHIPAKREKYLVRLPELACVNNKVMAIAYRNDMAHFALATLNRPRQERMFSGAGFANSLGPISGDLTDFFRRGSTEPELRRARIRGGIFDLDCCIRKGVIAAQTQPEVRMAYPYLSPELVALYENLSPAQMFDYDASINKKVLRSFLKRVGINSSYSNLKKGSFRFNLDKLADFYTPSPAMGTFLGEFGLSKKISTLFETLLQVTSLQPRNLRTSTHSNSSFQARIFYSKPGRDH